MDYYNGNKIKIKRDSFSDRICDDLCEIIVSYLSFEEKVLFECVSKQFQRCVYTKQKILEVIDKKDKNPKNTLNKLLLKSQNISNDTRIDLKAFESVLKKCQFLNKIVINHELNEDADKLLQLIAENCNYLKFIDLDFNDMSEKTLIQFGISCGQKLRSIEFLQRDYNKNYKALLKYCPNLSALNAVKLSDFISSDKQLFMIKLTEISLICLPTQIHLLDTFVSQYKNSINRFGIVSGLNNTLDTNIINFLMKKICAFEKLEELYFEFNFMKGFNLSYNNNMKTIAKQCPKIRRL